LSRLNAETAISDWPLGRFRCPFVTLLPESYAGKSRL